MHITVLKGEEKKPKADGRVRLSVQRTTESLIFILLGISKRSEEAMRNPGHMGIFMLSAKEIYLPSNKVRWNKKIFF